MIIITKNAVQTAVKKIPITKCQLLIVNIDCRNTMRIIAKTITEKPPNGAHPE